jgi:sugar phosphate isomerase/epimerase
MNDNRYKFTLFVKPWPDKTLPELAQFVRHLGLDGIELPIRSGFQVTPEHAAKGLAEAVHIFKDNGLSIESVAGAADGQPDETLIAACGESGVPILRLMARIDMTKGYHKSVENIQRIYDKFIPLLEKHKVALGIQNHWGYNVASAIGVYHLVEKYDTRQVGIVLDPAHCGLDGESEDMAIDIALSKTLMVNLKNGFWQRTSNPEAAEAEWKVYWTAARQGFISWHRVFQELEKRDYRGTICLHAEYTASDNTDRLIQEDIAYLKTILSFTK